MGIEKILTLEEARRNEQGWQRELSEALMIFHDLERQENPDRTALRKTKRRIDDAKNALNWYNGEIRYKSKRDANGREVYDENGRRIYTDEIEFQSVGAIQVLSGNAQKLKKQSNLGARFDSRTFATFDKSKDKNAYEQASRFAEMDNLFTDRGNGRIFIGGTGTGKTHLAASITNVLVGREIPVLFATFSEHLNKIKSQFDTPEDGNYLNEMKSVMMLIVDDLGTEIESDYSRQVLYDVINYRYEHRLPIVITTNLTTRGLQERYEDRIYSRLFEMCEVVTMNGSDYRTRGN